jgi:hypothetical protein
MALDVTTFEDGNGDLIADARAVISRLCADHSDPSHVIAPSDSQIDSRETTVIPALVEPPAAENDRPRPKPVAMAVALLKDHPDWSASKLAAAAGCHHTTLTRSTFFNRAKGITSSGHERNRGSKSADGRIEAEDNSAADEIDAIDEAIDSAEKPQRTTSRTTDD